MTTLDSLVNAAALAVFSEPVIYRSGMSTLTLRPYVAEDRCG